MIATEVGKDVHHGYQLRHLQAGTSGISSVAEQLILSVQDPVFEKDGISEGLDQDPNSVISLFTRIRFHNPPKLKLSNFSLKY